MAHSEYLSHLTQEKRNELINELWESQEHKCFVSGKEIDLELHKDSLDVDHVIALNRGGKDDPSNFALEFADANRSKSDKDLSYARTVYRYKNLCEECAKKDNSSPNLEDVLKLYGGSKYELKYRIENNFIKFTYSDMGINDIITLPVYEDKLSDMQYFFAVLPIEYIFHDEQINPRKINSSLTKLLDEFYNGYPQLHILLGYIQSDNGQSKVMIFDGQHKAAAQIFLNAKALPVRIFINPDTKKLTDTNLHAGTTLRQVAFDKSVISGLGSVIYRQHLTQYQETKKLQSDDFNFSEKDLLGVFMAEGKTLKKYIVDDVKDFVNESKENLLIDFVEMGGRSTQNPLSYSTLDKTLYTQFINKEPLDTNFNYKKDEGKNPRDLEKNQLIKLMNIIADKLLLNGKFNKAVGTAKIEDKIKKYLDDKTPLQMSDDHIRACRMLEEVCFRCWTKRISIIIRNYFNNVKGREPKPNFFQEEITDQLWHNIENYIKNLANLPLWKNYDYTRTVFGGKQTDAFWEKIFNDGETPAGVKVSGTPINVNTLIIN